MKKKGIIADAGHIIYADVAGITELYVGGKYEEWIARKGLTSLKGIEYFTALTELRCNNNQLTTLDVSKNTALTVLWCETNPGKDGIFKITLWPESELKAEKESWEYNGQPIAVKYLGKSADP